MQKENEIRSLEVLFEGNTSIEHSKFTILQQQVNDSVILENETPQHLIRIGQSLVATMSDHGCKDNDDDGLGPSFSKPSPPTTRQWL